MRRSDSIRNRLQPRPKVPNYGGPKVGITGAVRSNFVLKARLPGTEFLDAETGRQKSPLKCANVGRDQNPRSEWPEIPAETPYSESYRKRAVCEDWMVVEAVRYEPVSDCNSLIRAVLQGIFAKNCLFRESGPDFGSNDQRLSGKFPTFVNREFF